METTTTDRRTDVLKASPRMFESDLLDKLSRVHPSVPVILFLPAILVLLGLGVGFGQGYLLGRPSEPWSQVSETVAHALSVGALRHWGDGERAAPGGPPGPVNRRMGRYR